MTEDLSYPYIRFHVRPGGRHFHASLNCGMLTAGQYEHYKYAPTSLAVIKRNDLEPCVCVYDTLKSHHRQLSATSVKSILDRCGWREAGNGS